MEFRIILFILALYVVSAPAFSQCNQCTNGACALPAAGIDLDSDTIPDRLENQLAHRFFPNLWLREHAQDTDVFYGTHRFPEYNTTVPYRVAFAPTSSSLSLVCATARNCLEIRYGLAYEEDFGDGVWPVTSIDNHIGDAEFAAYIAWTDEDWAIAQNNPNVWRVAFSRLNHHKKNTIQRYHYCQSSDSCSQYSNFYTCHGNGSANNCAWNSTGNGNGGFCASTTGASQTSCSAPSPPLTAWVSEKKHATFPTKSKCNSGGFLGADDCSENDFNARAAVVSGDRLQNIGELNSPIDSTISSPWNCTEYDIFDNTPFAESDPYFEKVFDNLGW